MKTCFAFFMIAAKLSGVPAVRILFNGNSEEESAASMSRSVSLVLKFGVAYLIYGSVCVSAQQAIVVAATAGLISFSWPKVAQEQAIKYVEYIPSDDLVEEIIEPTNNVLGDSTWQAALLILLLWMIAVAVIATYCVTWLWAGRSLALQRSLQMRHCLLYTSPSPRD